MRNQRKKNEKMLKKEKPKQKVILWENQDEGKNVKWLKNADTKKNNERNGNKKQLKMNMEKESGGGGEKFEIYMRAK